MFKKITLPMPAMLALAACDAPSQTSLRAAPGSTAQGAVNAVLITRAEALFIAAVCNKRGIALRDTNYRAALTRDVRSLNQQGFTLPELDKAAKRATGNQQLAKAAVARLKAKGARRNDPASICAVGRREMAAGTAVGRLLKKN